MTTAIKHPLLERPATWLATLPTPAGAASPGRPSVPTTFPAQARVRWP